MLRKLQKRFILSVFGVSSIVLILISILAGFINYHITMTNADKVTLLIAENNFNLPSDFRPNPNEFSLEIAHTTRFFTVKLNANKIININMNRIRPLPSTDIIKLVGDVNNSNNERGRIANFRYRVIEDMIIFLDIEEQLRIFETFALYSAFVSLFALIGIILLSIIISKGVVYPIVESSIKQKRFITDISHELKTPLAIIKSNNDILELDNADVECTKSIGNQIGKLSLLIDNLISLSKLEEQERVVKTDFSLSEALLESLEEFKSTFETKNLNLTKEISKNVSYRGDEISIRKLFLILIENAVKYSNQNGDIKVVLNKDFFEIHNSCEELSDGDYAYWFDRFYRDDSSRNSNGYGIGLAIAKAICENHKIKISATIKNKVIIRLDF